MKTMENDGGKIKHLRKIIDLLKQYLLQNIHLSFSVKKWKSGKNIFFWHFGHYLISACCDIRLISVRDATYNATAVSHIMYTFEVVQVLNVQCFIFCASNIGLIVTCCWRSCLSYLIVVWRIRKPGKSLFREHKTDIEVTLALILRLEWFHSINPEQRFLFSALWDTGFMHDTSVTYSS